ncbi:sulfotransferase family protein [Nonomuraea sp. SYSU D8015]|uniref:sulfotransferase family protein n=1 Tax=Nonomuraea sp. SYSU D8015 TaxID=2593644 RepID=UPI001660AFDE|nr:sulfotransferase [Nonomuraea sp. SYSU D8015]
MSFPSTSRGALLAEAPRRSRSPVLIIGTERSGSNMLRLILDAHSQITVPHPPHFMRYLSPIAASYGDLSVEANRRALARDALRLLRTHIHPWPHRIDRELVVAEAGTDLFGLVSAIYEQYRRAENKERWGCKSTFMVDHVDEVRRTYPDAKFVWLVRDPRDVAASAKRSVFGHCHPYLTARLWRAQQERALLAHRRLGPGTVHRLRYEDLVTDPAGEVERLCAFLEVEVEPAMLRHHQSPSAQRIARMSESWRNVGRPITAAKIGSHRSSLWEEERLQVEAVAGSLMGQLGYDVRESRRTPRPSYIGIRGYDLALRALVELRSLRHDDNHMRRWSREAVIRWLRIKARVRDLAPMATRS